MYIYNIMPSNECQNSNPAFTSQALIRYII
jgi:hypothetical protein